MFNLGFSHGLDNYGRTDYLDRVCEEFGFESYNRVENMDGTTNDKMVWRGHYFGESGKYNMYPSHCHYGVAFEDSKCCRNGVRFPNYDAFVCNPYDDRLPSWIKVPLKGGGDTSAYCVFGNEVNVANRGLTCEVKPRSCGAPTNTAEMPGGFASVVTATSTAVHAGSTSIQLVDVSQIEVGDGLVIVNEEDYETATVTSVSPGRTRSRRDYGTVALDVALKISYPAGATVTTFRMPPAAADEPLAPGAGNSTGAEDGGDGAAPESRDGHMVAWIILATLFVLTWAVIMAIYLRRRQDGRSPIPQTMQMRPMSTPNQLAQEGKGFVETEGKGFVRGASTYSVTRIRNNNSVEVTADAGQVYNIPTETSFNADYAQNIPSEA